MILLKKIGAIVGTTLGIALVIFIAVLVFKIKGALEDAQTAKDTADMARLKTELSEVKASLAIRDSAALLASRTFLTARDTRRPVVTGGGPKADSIANAAVGSCFELATNALTTCQQARITADSVPILRDSIFNIEKRLLNPKKWTAYGGLYYVYPTKAPMLRLETQLELLKLLKANVGADHVFSSTLPDSLRTRYYIGGTIPFR